ncbi:MAG: MarR family transcriptional regulator [Eubacterium sp.]|nr:MarR family transcriptional regulator [Eubacterium sp.]
MSAESEVLQLRVLLWFLNTPPEDCNVTALSKALNKEKYQISRQLQQLEKDGLINREDTRHPCLTQYGMERGMYYKERLDLTISHLVYEGVDLEHARNDAYYWALYNSDKTMEVIKAMDEKCQIKNYFRGKDKFTGRELAETIRDGVYQLQFIINREHSKVGKTVSMSNSAFDHPCVLAVKEGTGTVQLHSVPIKAFSPFARTLIEGKAKSVKYFQDGMYHQAEFGADVVVIPLEAFQFYSNGTGTDQIIYGSLMMKLQASVGNVHMPESKAILTLIL